MKIESYISRPGKDTNEDFLIMLPSCAGILDGSSGLGGLDFGAKDFVETFAEHFEKQINIGGTLVESVNHAIEIIKDKYALEKGKISPSASLLLVMETSNQLQILSIGDCYCQVFYNNGDYKLISRDEVAPFDQAVISRMLEIRKDTDQDLSTLLRTDEIQDFLISNRKKMNAPDGYRILAPNMEFVREEEVVILPKDNISNLVLFSDGFSLMFDEFKNRNWDLERVFDLLRSTEHSDETLNKYPRLKISDDASAIVLSI